MMPQAIAIYSIAIDWQLTKPIKDVLTSNPQMTVEVAAGSEDCFFLPEVKSGQSIELEFQVTFAM